MIRVKVDVRGLNKLRQNIENTTHDLKNFTDQRLIVSGRNEEDVKKQAKEIVKNEINKILKKNFR